VLYFAGFFFECYGPKQATSSYKHKSDHKRLFRPIRSKEQLQQISVQFHTKNNKHMQLHITLSYGKFMACQLQLWRLTDWLTIWSRALFEKMIVPQIAQKFPALYGTQRSITAFTTAHHLSLSLARSIQPTPLQSHFLEIHFNIIHPSTVNSYKWSLSLRLPGQKHLCISPLPHTCHMPRQSHASWLHYSNNIRWNVDIMQLLITKSIPVSPRPF